MEKFKAFGSIFLGMVACFIIGAYAESTIHGGKYIEPHRWAITSLFGLYFLISGILRVKREL